MEVSNGNKSETSPYMISRCSSYNILSRLDDIYNDPKEDKTNFMLFTHYNTKTRDRYTYSNMTTGKLSQVIITTSNKEYNQAEYYRPYNTSLIPFCERKAIQSYLNIKSNSISFLIPCYSYYRPENYEYDDSYMFYYRFSNCFNKRVSNIDKYNYKDFLSNGYKQIYLLSLRFYNCINYLNNGPKKILDVILDNKQYFGSVNYYYWNKPQIDKVFYSMSTSGGPDYFFPLARRNT